MENAVVVVFVVLLVLCAVAAVIGLIRYQLKLVEKRRQEMADLASQLGWHFDPTKNAEHDDEYAHFEIFRRGHSRAAYNTLTGSTAIGGRAFPATMGDFTYKVTRSNGKTTTTTTYNFSYLI